MYRLNPRLEILQRAAAQVGTDLHALREDGYDAVFIHQNGIVAAAEPVMAALIGCRVEQLIGQNIWQSIAHESTNIVMEHLQNHAESAYDVILRRKGGMSYPLRVKAKNVEVAGEQFRIVQVRFPDDLKKILRDKQLA